MAVADIQWIGESTLHHTDFDGLYAFFQKVWEQKHTYIAAMARRCFNLNDVFLQLHLSLGKNAPHADRVISNNALLLCADEIADHYQAHGYFPSILLADDILLHGRGISKLLYSLEELIVARLQQSAEISANDRYYIHRDLIAAIDIFVYAMNKQPLLIDDSYRWKVHRVESRYGSELRELSQRISIFLQRVDMPNTSYVLSVKLPGFDAEVCKSVSNWRHISWQNCGNTQETFVWDTSFRQMDATATVRISRNNAYRTDSAPWATGLVVFESIKQETLDALCNDAAKLLEPIPETAEMCRILRRTHSLLQKQRAQFLSFLQSAICLSEFCKAYGIASDLDTVFANSDIKKIASNFSQGNTLFKAFQRLCKAPSVLSQLKSLLYSAPDSDTPPLPTGQKGEKKPASYFRALNEAAENLIYHRGMQSEKDAYEISSNLKRFHPEKHGTDLICLGNYRTALRKELSADNGTQNLFSEQEQIACTLMLMDSGLMAMNLEWDDQSSSILCVLKAGELSTYVLPRRFRLFMPALALVEQDCRRLDLEPKTAVIQFILSLSEDPAPCSDRSGEEQRLLRQLKRRGEYFVDTLYQCGQRLNDWDINFSTVDDWQEENKGTYLSFVLYEHKVREKYLEKAKQFLGYH